MSKGRISERLRKKLNEGTMTTPSNPIETVSETRSDEDWSFETAYPGWSKATCSRCSGHGVIWLGIDGGPGECPDCNSGTVFVTPKGRHVFYPGGPFCAG